MLQIVTLLLDYCIKILFLLFYEIQIQVFRLDKKSKIFNVKLWDEVNTYHYKMCLGLSSV